EEHTKRSAVDARAGVLQAGAQPVQPLAKLLFRHDVVGVITLGRIQFALSEHICPQGSTALERPEVVARGDISPNAFRVRSRFAHEFLELFTSKSPILDGHAAKLVQSARTKAPGSRDRSPGSLGRRFVDRYDGFGMHGRTQS